MKIFVENHSLCLHIGKRVFLVRPALSWDGRTGRPWHGSLPWFKIETWAGKKTIWKFFTIPFLAFGLVLRVDAPSPEPREATP